MFILQQDIQNQASVFDDSLNLLFRAVGLNLVF